MNAMVRNAPSGFAAGLKWLLLVATACPILAEDAAAEKPGRVTWKGVEVFEEAYAYDGRISAHLGNVNEYSHKIVVHFTYVEETDAAGTMRWVSRKIDWEATGKAVAEGFTATVCEGSGSVDLGPAQFTFGEPDYVTDRQEEQLRIPCETKDFGILAGSFVKPPDEIEPPRIVNREQLRAGCSYSERRPGYRYSVWVNPGCKCDPTLYQDYLRKKQAADELFQHSQDLRRTADQQIEDFLQEEMQRWGMEAGFETAGQAGEAGIKYAAGIAQQRLKGQRSVLMEKAAGLASRYGPAVKVGTSVGPVITAADSVYRAQDSVRRRNDWNAEAQEARERSADLWASALADFVADLAQSQACLEESRKARAEEERLDRAKELIEEWENNQVLYRDPISQEALTYEAAVKRALDSLGAPSASHSSALFNFFPVAFADGPEGSTVMVTAGQLDEAIRELDIAIAALSRLADLVDEALGKENALETELDVLLGAAPGNYALALYPRSTYSPKPN